MDSKKIEKEQIDMIKDFYKVKRNFRIWDRLDICAITKRECIDTIYELLDLPICSSVDLLGIPMSVQAMEKKELADMYNNATMTIVDGMPVVKMCRKAGIVCERCSGPDIMPDIFARSVREGKTHYFYGGNNEEVLFKLKKKLELCYPGIMIAGMYAPPFRKLTEKEENELCNEINGLKPDFIWVGIGAPKQELWMQEHQDKLERGVMIGVGAAFNFFSGTVDKAPHWIEDAGMEWLYRMMKEPKRLWKRYIIGGIKYIRYNAIYSNIVLKKE